MSNRPFRFLVAGDFHLEQPLGGVAEVPDHLRELFLDAPYTAARRAFDAALAEDADFVLLTGDILRPSDTGPRGPLFLVEQFLRLSRARDCRLLGRRRGRFTRGVARDAGVAQERACVSVPPDRSVDDRA